MQTGPCNAQPLTPHFYTVKRGFTGVYIIVSYFALKHRLWVLVRTEAVLMCSHNQCFEKKIRKTSYFSSDYDLIYSYILHGRVFVM